MTKAIGPQFQVHFRRRRKGLTDYGTRLGLLKSEKPRLVVRKTNRYVIVHVSAFDSKGDRTLAHATSQQLKDYGFDGKCNTPSAYLTGFLVGRMAKAAGVAAVNLDIGLHTSTQGSLVFSALKGAMDAGVESNLDEDKLAAPERMNGAHLKKEEQFKKAKQAIEQADFSKAKASKKVERK